jgi:WD40 repeat protein
MIRIAIGLSACLALAGSLENEPSSRPAASLPAVAVAAAGGGASGRVFASSGSGIVRWRDGAVEPVLDLAGMDRLCALASDGNALFAGGGVPGKSGSVVRVDLQTFAAEPVEGMEAFGDTVTALCLVGGRLVAGSADRTARIVNITKSGRAAGPAIELRGHTGPVLAAAGSGDWVATGAADRTIRIWSLRDGELLRTLTQHAGAVNALAVVEASDRLPDWLVSASDDRTVRMWDPATGRQIKIVREHGGSVLALRAGPRAPSGRRAKTVYSGASDGCIREIEVESGAVSVVASHAGRWIYCICAGSDGVPSAAGTDRGVVPIPPPAAR